MTERCADAPSSSRSPLTNESRAPARARLSVSAREQDRTPSGPEHPGLRAPRRAVDTVACTIIMTSVMRSGRCASRTCRVVGVGVVGKGGPPAGDQRGALATRIGAPWRDLPPRTGRGRRSTTGIGAGRRTGRGRRSWTGSAWTPTAASTVSRGWSAWTARLRGRTTTPPAPGTNRPRTCRPTGWPRCRWGGSDARRAHRGRGRTRNEFDFRPSADFNWFPVTFVVPSAPTTVTSRTRPPHSPCPLRRLTVIHCSAPPRGTPSPPWRTRLRRTRRSLWTAFGRHRRSDLATR